MKHSVYRLPPGGAKRALPPLEASRKGCKQGSGAPDGLETRKKLGFPAISATFLLYFVWRVPYDENDS
jgi:hypothetical protein